MKINLKKLLKTVIVPAAAGVAVHVLATGKLDLKGAGLDLLQGALDKRKA